MKEREHRGDLACPTENQELGVRRVRAHQLQAQRLRLEHLGQAYFLTLNSTCKHWLHMRGLVLRVLRHLRHGTSMGVPVWNKAYRSLSQYLAGFITGSIG